MSKLTIIAYKCDICSEIEEEAQPEDGPAVFPAGWVLVRGVCEEDEDHEVCRECSRTISTHSQKLEAAIAAEEAM